MNTDYNLEPIQRPNTVIQVENSISIQGVWIEIEFFALLGKHGQPNAPVFTVFGTPWAEFTDSIQVLPGGVY